MIEGEPAESRPRARPLSPTERRAAIIGAVIPVLQEKGAAATSRDLAEAAGVAEGTLFRAFGTKDALIEAAVETHLDPRPLVASIHELDPSLTIDDALRNIIQILHDHFRSIMRLRALVWNHPKARAQIRTPIVPALAEVLERYTGTLNISADRLAAFARMVSMSSAFPMLNEGSEFSADELTRMILHGSINETHTGGATC